MTSPAITCQWTGDAFKPDPRFAKIADASFVVGERYIIEPEQPRSMASHRHQWPTLKEAWMNLPESLTEEFPTPEHLRKRGLIECGYRKEYRFACKSPADLIQAIAAITDGNEYAVISTSGNAGVVWVPMSQSMKTMPGGEFNKSKQAVLEWAFGLCGLKPDRSAA